MHFIIELTRKSIRDPVLELIGIIIGISKLFHIHPELSQTLHIERESNIEINIPKSDKQDGIKIIVYLYH